MGISDEQPCKSFFYYLEVGAEFEKPYLKCFWWRYIAILTNRGLPRVFFRNIKKKPGTDDGSDDVQFPPEKWAFSWLNILNTHWAQVSPRSFISVLN